MNVLGMQISRVEASPRQRWTRRVIAIGATSVLTFTGGTAYAFWGATGSGSGAATAGHVTALSATATVSDLLYPGGPAADVQVTFTNPNSFDVKVTSLSQDGAVTGSGGKGTCTTTGVSFASQANLSNVVVPAQSGETAGQLIKTFTGAVSMDNTASDGCQNASFTVPLTFSGVSNG